MRSPRSDRGQNRDVEPPRFQTEPIAIEEREIAATAAGLDALHGALDRLWHCGETQTSAFPDQRWRFEFTTAVVEIVANIVRHAYPVEAENTARTARLTFALLADRVEAILTDRGVALSGDLADLTPEPPADVLEESGRGLAIARSLLDELTYERRPDGTNRWRLMKRFAP